MAIFMDVNYPEDRTGVFLFPMFIGAIFFSLDGISKSMNKNILRISLLPFLFFPLHFLYSLNLNHSTLYMEENVPPRFTQRIADESLINEASTIGGYRMRLLTVAYQNYRLGGQLNQIQGSHYPEYLSDYQIVRAKEEEEWLKYYNILDYEASSGLSLLKRKETINTIELKNSRPKNSGPITKEYYNLYKGVIDTLHNENLLINVNMTIESAEMPFIGRLVAVSNDKNNKRISYEYVTLDWKKTEWNGEKNNFIASMIMYDIPKEAEVLSIYFWNIKKKEFILNDINISINKIAID